MTQANESNPQEESDVTEHTLTISVLPAMPAGMIGASRLSSTTDSIASCSCGWSSLSVPSQRAARREHQRHVVRAAKHGIDLGDQRTPDDATAVLRRHAAEPSPAEDQEPAG